MFHPNILNHPKSFTISLENIEVILSSVEREVSNVQKGVINIAFLSDDEIQALNKQYRGIDSTTDVLSFHYFDDFSEVSGEEIAGEIILSESKILSQAYEHNHSGEKEVEILVLHGILHILGFDHETDEDYAEMWKYEEGLRNTIEIHQTYTE